jgi:HAD superfamily hydrolase (TIGR01549 family)
MQKTFIIYDLDGTLINSMSIHNKAWLQFFKEYDLEPYKGVLAFSAGRLFKETLMSVLEKSSEQDLKRFYEKVGELTEEKIEHLRARRNELVEEQLNSFELFEGVQETLYMLKEKGLKLGVCTSATAQQVETFFQIFSVFSEVFDSELIDTAQVGRLGKPHADPLLRLLEKAQVKPENALFIGDAVSDYLSAEGAEIDFLLFNPELRHFEIEDVKEIRHHEEILKFLD